MFIFDFDIRIFYYLINKLLKMIALNILFYKDNYDSDLIFNRKFDRVEEMIEKNKGLIFLVKL